MLMPYHTCKPVTEMAGVQAGPKSNHPIKAAEIDTNAAHPPAVHKAGAGLSPGSAPETVPLMGAAAAETSKVIDLGASDQHQQGVQTSGDAAGVGRMTGNAGWARQTGVTASM